MKAIYYKNYLGKWTKSNMKPTEKNLEEVKKKLALNGQADIFEINKKTKPLL